MKINIFDLSNYKVPYYYERKLSSLKYNVEDFKKSINKILSKKKYPKEDYPWGEKRNSNKIKNLKNLVPNEEVHLNPMRLKYSFYSDKIITDSIINYSWTEFQREVNNIRLENKIFGESVHLDSLLSFSEENLKQKVIPEVPENGYIKNSVLRLKNIFEDFNQNRKFPIFIDTSINTKSNKISLTSSSSFCQILINKEYFSNSPLNLILGGKGIEEHDSGNISLPKLEDLCEYLIDKLNIDRELILNVFIDRVDYDDWLANQSVFEDKCYSIKNIVFIEKEENYYDQLHKQLIDSKQTYKTIVEYNPDNSKLDLDDCKILFNKIISE